MRRMEKTLWGLALALIALPGTGLAQVTDAAITEVFGAEGCTIGSESRARAVAAGLAPERIDAFAEAALSDGTATQHGDWIVLAASICTIRLPEIESTMQVDDPALADAILVVSKAEDPSETGCYLTDGADLFIDLAGGDRDVGSMEYIRFAAASVISGDLRFYGENPLRTPVGFRIMTGDCADYPQVPAIEANHRFIAEGFGAYIRALGAGSECAGSWSSSGMTAGAEVQGVDPNVDLEDQAPVNAWLYFEYDLIAMAAGWYEGMSGSDRGEPRPPLCHYAR